MLEAKFYETYYFCNIIRNILHDPSPFLRNLEGFYGDQAIFYLLEPFKKYSTFHEFIEFIVTDIYYETTYDVDLGNMKKTYYDLSTCSIDIEDIEDIEPLKLPIELAFEFHKIEYESFKQHLNFYNKTFFDCDEDDIYDYMSELMHSEAYEKLIDQTVKEIFYILFQNRELMLIFNEMISSILASRLNEYIPDEVKHLFKKSGVLNRKTISKWVKRAVYFRDRGCCVICRKDLSGILNLESLENYDHMVPLARHGLNDVSNIQLLCYECNQKKLAGRAITSNIYQSWYPYD